MLPRRCWRCHTAVCQCCLQEHWLGDGQACCHKGLLPQPQSLAARTGSTRMLMCCLSSVLCPNPAPGRHD